MSPGQHKDATTGRTPALGVAVIGVGRWGRNLVRVFDDLEGASLKSVCDLDPTRLEMTSSGVARATDVHEVFGDDQVQAVVIATPPATHAELAIAAMRAGKHVLVEKPMALATSDAERVARASERYGRRAMVGFVMQYHPAIELLKAWTAGGLLGDVRFIRTRRRGSRGGDADPGPWWSLAPHDVSLILSLSETDPTEIHVVRHELSPSVRVTARLTSTCGFLAEITVDDSTSRKERELVVVGTKAAALFDDTTPSGKLKLFQLARERDAAPEEIAASLAHRPPSAVPTLAGLEPLRAEAAHFVESLVDDSPFRTDVAEGVRVVEILEAGQRSLGSLGRRVSLARAPKESARFALLP